MKKITNNFFRSKKAVGIIGQGPTYFLITILLFIAIAVFFVVSLKLHFISPMPDSFSSKSEALVTLQSFLATPVEVNMKLDGTQTEKVSMKMVDLIRLYCMDKIKYPYKSQIETNASLILSKIYTEGGFSYNLYVNGCDLGTNSIGPSLIPPSEDYVELPLLVPGKEDVKIQLEIRRNTKTA